MAALHGKTDQLDAGVRVGDFEIEKCLGAGGMGIVYQARQVSLDRRVALKLLGPALTQPTDLARFQREARAAARIQHPGIASIHYIGQDAGVCYHVMELVDGIPLRRVIERLADAREVQTSPDTVVTEELTQPDVAPAVRFDEPTTDNVSARASNQPTLDERPAPPPPPGVASLTAAARQTRQGAAYIRRACEIVRDAARALAYAHGEGVVHRDIKPENLMLDRHGRVRIIDFGLARFFDDVSITQTGQLVGTPLYMSPEQVTGRGQVDQRTDVYSLGLVLYELLALRRPFDATGRESLLRNIVTKALPPLAGRNPSVPKALEAVVHKATHKDPEERYQTAEEFAADLDRFLAGKPVAAPPYRYRLDLQEVMARRPGAVVLTAFLCFMLGCSLFTILCAMGVMMWLISGGYAAAAGQSLTGLIVLVGAAALARGLLAGWQLARWVVILLAAVIALASTGTGVVMAAAVVSMVRAAEAAPAEEAGSFQPKFLYGMYGMYAVPLVLALLCAVTACVSLLLPGTRAWFRLAGQARREHQEMLASLGR